MPIGLLIIHQVAYLFSIKQAAIKEVEVRVDIENVVSEPDHFFSHGLGGGPAPGAILQGPPGGFVKLVELDIRTLE
jgi:hypothetical protein